MVGRSWDPVTDPYPHTLIKCSTKVNKISHRKNREDIHGETLSATALALEKSLERNTFTCQHCYAYSMEDTRLKATPNGSVKFVEMCCRSHRHQKWQNKDDIASLSLHCVQKIFKCDTLNWRHCSL